MKNLKKILSILVLFGMVFAVVQTRAANLSQALSTLSTSEEWSIMAYASQNREVGQPYLKSSLNGSATDYEKRILAITSQGENPRTFGSENFVAELLKKFDGTQIGEPNLMNDDIFGLLALKSTSESGDIINKLRTHILANQNSDGGWSFVRGGSSDSNTTAMAVAALKSTGSVPSSAVNYIKSTQNSDGGFGFTINQDSEGASTAWAIIGLRSAGSVPSNAINFLESLQTSSGSFKWKPTDANGSALVTSYAVIALSGKTLPLQIVNSSTPIPQPQPQPTPQPNPPPPQPNPNPQPVPVPQPQPAPQPQPNPLQPQPIFQPTPQPQALQHVPHIASISQSTYNVIISYPGNNIYVGDLNLNYQPRAIDTLILAAQEINLLYSIDSTGLGLFVNTVNGYVPSAASGWLYAVNGTTPAVSSSDYILSPGDRIQWFYGPPNTNPY